jgi:hypothetical protein
MATIKLLDAVGCLLLECSFDFLGDDTATEDAGERVADRSLELSLEALGDTHDDPLSGHSVSWVQISLLHGIYFCSDSTGRITPRVQPDMLQASIHPQKWP